MPTRFAVIVAAVTIASCSDAGLGADNDLGERTARLGAVVAVVASEPPNADGTVTFALRVRAPGVSVSAFQGAVRFAPGAFELVAMTSASSGGDEMYIVNAADFAAGTIRYAAFTPRAFAAVSSEDGVEVMRVTVRVLRPIATADVGTTLEAAAGPDGGEPRPPAVVPPASF
jgi:hypothetical protein